MAKKKTEAVVSVEAARGEHIAAVTSLIGEMERVLGLLVQVRDGVRFPNESPELVDVRSGCDVVLAKGFQLRTAELLEENGRLRAKKSE